MVLRLVCSTNQLNICCIPDAREIAQNMTYKVSALLEHDFQWEITLEKKQISKTDIDCGKSESQIGHQWAKYG